ncbi:nucleotidyltransferase domain-containing protein [Candidatus Woesearchaeota archaeon]|nr:nucleotidyltransferase domain-containing protein [Candidatus Woesearchaeota archaeon]HIH25361.1 nucleotidyltransferase domain-containing protein [Nanoarchaeota archaeon]
MKKEENILELFYNEPTKHWHFEEILKQAKISRPQANHWIKRFIADGMVIRTKPKNKMPYYISNYQNPNYQNKKRLLMLNKLNNIGFLNHLTKLKADTIILFGSISRWDWYKDSDIDIFIYGDEHGLEIEKYKDKTKRDIQVFSCKTKEELKNFTPGLLRNIIEGYIIKGDLNFIKVKTND